jgi:hypothetical protein
MELLVQRISRPFLADVEIGWGGLEVPEYGRSNFDSGFPFTPLKTRTPVVCSRPAAFLRKTQAPKTERTN